MNRLWPLALGAGGGLLIFCATILAQNALFPPAPTPAPHHYGTSSTTHGASRTTQDRDDGEDRHHIRLRSNGTLGFDTGSETLNQALDISETGNMAIAGF